MIKAFFYLSLFIFTFSIFFIPVVINAQGTTFWNLERDTGLTTPNALNMYLTVSGAPQAKAVTILQNGNVGINTTAPAGILDVQGPSGTFTQSFFRSAAGQSNYLELGNATNGFVELQSDTNGNFNLNTNGVAAGVLQMIRTGSVTNTIVMKSGNVGIGTAAPAGKLDTQILANKHIGFVNWNNMPTLASFNDGLTAWGDMTIAPSGNVGVGTYTPTAKLDVAGNLAVSGTFSPTNLAVSGTFTAANGGYAINSAGTSRFLELRSKNWSTAGGATMCFASTVTEVVAGNNLYTIGACSSDRRLKKNIRYFKDSVLDKVKQLKPATFDLKDDSRHDIPGFIAQDVQQIFPEAVIDQGPNEMLQFSPEQLVPQLTKAIQELSEKVDAQQKEIEMLKQIKQSQ